MNMCARHSLALRRHRSPPPALQVCGAIRYGLVLVAISMATGDTKMLAQAGDNTPLKATFEHVAAMVDARGDQAADAVFKQCSEVVFSIISVVIQERERERSEEREELRRLALRV